MDNYIEHDIKIQKRAGKWLLNEGKNSYKIESPKDLETLYPEFKLNNKLGFVYLIESEYGYKIGKSKTLESRLKLFNVKLPFNWKLVDYILTEQYNVIEKRLHRLFEDKLIDGEWFKLDKTDLNQFNKLSNKYRDMRK